MDTKNSEQNNKPSKRKINWGNVFISALVGLAWYLLIRYLFRRFVILFYDGSIDLITLCNIIYLGLLVINTIIFMFIAHKFQTTKYKNCSGPIGVIIGVIILKGFGVWILFYQFLQIKGGFAELKSNSVKEQ